MTHSLIPLKYGCNPNQKPACIYMDEGPLPIRVLNGRPGYINFLDALNGWQLARELKELTGLPAAASFKHVSPAGAAIGLPLGPVERQMYFVGDAQLSPLAAAYTRARGADRMSSFGDFIALSDICDETTARIIRREVSDGIIAPGFDPAALELLKSKRGGSYNIIEIDEAYTPDPIERKHVFGVTFEQRRNGAVITEALLDNIVTRNRDIPKSARRDLAVALITLKYTQSNSVCYVKDGQTIGVGAGQQSRIHCTRLAGNKADLWRLRQHPRVLSLRFAPGLGRPERDNAVDCFLSRDEYMDVAGDGVWERFFEIRPEPLSEEEKRVWLDGFSDTALASDAFFPFGDNIERAYRSGVKYIAQPGGSVRDDHVIAACDKYDMAMAFTGLRLFHH